MTRFVELLGNPQNDFPIIHVAGTNGKGSVCAMLDSIYRTNGYRVGLFSSPHLIELGERVRVDGKNITENEIQERVRQLKPIAQKMEDDGADGHPTFFEFMTAIAFLTFQKSRVDLAIIETGLGGRLDSTNVVTPKLSIITTISKDHCAILGDTLEEIATEKAGIIKREVPVLIGNLPTCAHEVVQKIAFQQDAPFYTISHLKEEKYPKTNLVGSYQIRNAALAFQSTELLEQTLPIQSNLTSKGLNTVNIPGRWQVIDGSSTIILDACHNADGALCLKENLETLTQKPEIWIGVLGEDRAEDIMKVVIEFACSLKLFEVQQPRACSIDYLRSLIPDSFCGEVIDFDLEKAKEEFKKSTSNKTILVTGSIYLIGDILSLLADQDFDSKVDWNDLF
jgi:dihydrofolate synthase/folylpolyglutamate synthase